MGNEQIRVAIAILLIVALMFAIAFFFAWDECVGECHPHELYYKGTNDNNNDDTLFIPTTAGGYMIF